MKPRNSRLEETPIAPLVFLSASLLLLSICGIVLVLLVYPLSIWLRAHLFPLPHRVDTQLRPLVSIVVVARNAESFIQKKLLNCLALDYPPDQLECIFFSDGSTDRTVAILRAALASQNTPTEIKVFSSEQHLGKANALNRAVEETRGEMLLFSDADALLEQDALLKMLRHFGDAQIGGVCGQRIIGADFAAAQDSQRTYTNWDSALKQLESTFGSTTSNDGKLYSVRRQLFRPIPEAVTDDLFVALAIIDQGYRFIFEPGARVWIHTPARSLRHEVSRRRRIVCRSLRGIYLMSNLLNPAKSGSYAISLAINKILRRFLPVMLLLLFFSSLLLSFRSEVAVIILLPQAVFYALGLAHVVLPFQFPAPFKPVSKMASLACYFSVGNFGTLLGVLDFLAGRKVTKWDPLKSEESADPE